MRRRLIATLIAVGVALAAGTAVAASIEGQWRGSGVVSYRNTTDAVRCRVSFHRLSATAFSVSSQCATKTGRYDVKGRVVAAGANRFYGPVQGEEVTGIAVVVLHGKRLSITVSSRRGSAKLELSRL